MLQRWGVYRGNQVAWFCCLPELGLGYPTVTLGLINFALCLLLVVAQYRTLLRFIKMVGCQMEPAAEGDFCLWVAWGSFGGHFFNEKCF